MRLLFICYLLVILPAVAWAAPSGEELYARNCAACHGSEGSGGVGVPLALPDFQYGVTDLFLKRTIRFGRPGRVMPAFPELNDAEVNAIIKHIRSWAPGKPTAFPQHKVKGDPAKGKQLFDKYCAACHGANGTGGKGTGVTFSRPRNLPIIAPALNNKGFLASASDQLIKAALMNGREGTPMVSFLKQGLSEKDIDNIVSYVRSFENQQPATKEKSLQAHEKTIIYESPYNTEQTIKNIERAAVGKNFRLIRNQTMDDGFVKKEQENKKQTIIYFCNFGMLNEALTIDPRVGLFLPCRVTVVEHDDGKVEVMAINPKYLSVIFNNQELDKLCDGMYETYVNIIEEATL